MIGERGRAGWKKNAASVVFPLSVGDGHCSLAFPTQDWRVYNAPRPNEPCTHGDIRPSWHSVTVWNPDVAGPLAAAVDIGHGPPPESPRSPGLQPNLATMLAKDDQLFIATFGEKRGTLTIVRLSL